MIRPVATVRLQLVPRPSGSGSTVEALYRAHAGYVASLAVHVLGRDDEVDDVVQDVFLRAMKGLAALRDAAAVRGWLGTITVRVARRRLRLRRVLSLFGLDVPPNYEEELVAPGASPEQRAVIGRAFHLLDRLPVPQRLAWALRHVEGEPLEEVARLCGCSLATAKRRIAAAQREIETRTSDE